MKSVLKLLLSTALLGGSVAASVAQEKTLVVGNLSDPLIHSISQGLERKRLVHLARPQLPLRQRPLERRRAEWLAGGITWKRLGAATDGLEFY